MLSLSTAERQDYFFEVLKPDTTRLKVRDNYLPYIGLKVYRLVFHRVGVAAEGEVASSNGLVLQRHAFALSDFDFVVPNTRAVKCM
jgi:hypothetical protein